MKVSDVMRTKLITVRPQDSVMHLDEVLARHRITGAPVMDGDAIVGVVSRSDVVRQLEVERSRFEGASWYLEPFDAEQRQAEDEQRVPQAMAARLSQLRVAEVMTREVLAVEADAELATAARRMAEKRVHRLIVLEAGKLAGLVSSLDLLQGFADAAGESS